MINTEYIDLCKLCVVVNFGQGSKVARIASENGIHGGTILVGKGTYYSKFLELFGLTESRKEIVWLVCSKNKAENAMEVLSKELKLKGKNTGIAYIEPIKVLYGKNKTKYMNNVSEEEYMLEAIYTIVDKGKGHSVVEAASIAGANGGTIVEGRGAGAHQAHKVFGIDIEPEKEIVITITDISKSEAIVESIKNRLDIEMEGHGIIFVHPISKNVGINRV